MKENDHFRVSDNKFTVSKVIEKPVAIGRWTATQSHQAIAIYRETFFALDDRKEKSLIQLYYFQEDSGFIARLKKYDRLNELREFVNKNIGDKMEPGGYDIYVLIAVDSIRGRTDQNLCYIWSIETALDFRGHWAPKENAIAQYVVKNLPNKAKITLRNKQAYSVDEYLSAFGAFSTVFKGIGNNDLRPVALKIQHSDTASHEAAVLSTFAEHKNIVSFFGCDDIVEYYHPFSRIQANPFGGTVLVRDDETWVMTTLRCLVTEFIEGSTLEKFKHGRKRQKQRLSIENAINFIEQICDTVQHIHEAGFLHLDLKPQNIMVDKQGVIKFVDMGSVVEKGQGFVAFGGGPHASPEVREYIYNQPRGWSLLTRLYKPNQIVFGSPQQIEASQKAQQKIAETSDVFSIGALFYQMLIGHTPRHIANYKNPAVRIEKILMFNQEFPADAKCFISVLEKAMDIEPKRRFQSCKDLKNAIVRAYRFRYYESLH